MRNRMARLITMQPHHHHLSTREVYRNHWMRLREDEILRSNGQKASTASWRT